MFRKGQALILVSALAACSAPSNEASDNVAKDALDPVKVAEQTLVEPNLVASEKPIKSSDPSSQYKAAISEIATQGAMVLKVDTSIFNADGYLTELQAGKAVLFTDPLCDTCLDGAQRLKEDGIDYVVAPVSFYAEDGLDKVGAYICEAKGFEDPSDNCAAAVKAMTNNTGMLMREGIVELPAVMLPDGWLFESGSMKDVKALIDQRRADG